MKIETNSTSLTIRTENADDQYRLGRIAEKTKGYVYGRPGEQRTIQLDADKVVQILAGIER